MMSAFSDAFDNTELAVDYSETGIVPCILPEGFVEGFVDCEMASSAYAEGTSEEMSLAPIKANSMYTVPDGPFRAQPLAAPAPSVHALTKEVEEEETDPRQSLSIEFAPLQLVEDLQEEQQRQEKLLPQRKMRQGWTKIRNTTLGISVASGILLLLALLLATSPKLKQDVQTAIISLQSKLGGSRKEAAPELPRQRAPDSGFEEQNDLDR